MQGDNRVAYLVSAASSIAVVSSLIPNGLWSFVSKKVSFYTEVEVQQRIHDDGYNEIFADMELYIATLTSGKQSTARRLNLSSGKKAGGLSYGLASGETLQDEFQGARFWWSLQVTQPRNPTLNIWKSNQHQQEQRSYTIACYKKHRHTVLPDYIDHIVNMASALKLRNHEKQLFTNSKTDRYNPYMPWRSVPFKHPSTFESMALEPKLKKMIMDDLDTFMNAGEFYQRVGRAWKRGYLLHGPPGTGKSSLIAAMANYTGYDVYDMELTEVSSNAELRNMLTHVNSKSIIVIEDIDCSLELKKRGRAKADNDDGDDGSKKDESSKVTLSGLLNFTDGLWSSCGDEQIIVFTTNFMDRIDAALLRPGRMDVHIAMSYCTFEAFKRLAWTYLRLSDHGLFPEIEQLFGDSSIQMTPAEVAEVLVEKSAGAPEAALASLVQAMLQHRMKIVAAAAAAAEAVN